MSKKIKLELTEAQLEALLDMADEYEAVLGSGDGDQRNEWRNVRLFNNMCKANLITRPRYVSTVHFNIP